MGGRGKVLEADKNPPSLTKKKGDFMKNKISVLEASAIMKKNQEDRINRMMNPKVEPKKDSWITNLFKRNKA